MAVVRGMRLQGALPGVSARRLGQLAEELARKPAMADGNGTARTDSRRQEAHRNQGAAKDSKQYEARHTTVAPKALECRGTMHMRPILSARRLRRHALMA
jgi:hypothetical protein